MRKGLLIVVAIAAFLVISWGLARFLTTESHERGKVVNLLEAQVHGDAGGMLDQLAPACANDPRCRAQVEELARRMRREGEPKVIAYQSGTAYALGSKTGTTRVAWTVVGRGLPVVQCVVVRRDGTALAGRRVTLLRVSAPIGNESSC